MAGAVRVQVEKEIWNWAFNESQKDEEEIFNKFPRINEWIHGEKSLTFRQLEEVANYLKVPFGYMFLESPPEENVMEVEFRSINNKLPEVSKNLKDTILEMDNRRNWMSDYRKSLGWSKLDIIFRFNEYKNENVVDDAVLAKKLLDLEDNWYEFVKGFDEAYKLVRRKLEEAGILVMQNGVVGMNTQRSLDINEFRAFMLYDHVSPLIFINSRDTKAGKVFSLVHEYIHVLFEQDYLFLDTDEDAKENERYINNITAEFLMPEEHIYRLWNKNDKTPEQINKLSRVFKVSRLALAIKLRNMSLIDNKLVEIIKYQSIEDFENKGSRSGKGDFYRTYNSRISPVFTEAVINAVETGEISYTYAFKLLGGIKGKTYDKIKELMMSYE